MVCYDVWTSIAGQRYQKSENGMIVKDVRFENERGWLSSWDGVLIHVIRPNFFATEATKGHPSNIPLEIRRSDVVIINDSTLDVLQSRVVEAVENLI